MSNRLKLQRQRAVRHQQPVEILLDGSLRYQIEAVEDALDRLDEAPPSKDRRMSSKSNDAERASLLADIERLRSEAEESTLFLVLEGLQRTAFRAMLAQHPPRLGQDGKVLPQDRLLGANIETLAAPLVRACTVGYRERNDVAAPVLAFPPDLVGYKPNAEEVTLGWLFGFSYKDAETDEVVTVDPFCTERQIDQAAAVAIAICAGDDAVPLPRQRSTTSESVAG